MKRNNKKQKVDFKTEIQVWHPQLGKGSTTSDEIIKYAGSKFINSYPESNKKSAGYEFIFNGRKWHYMTQEHINQLGWDVEEGFPAPVEKVYDIYTTYPTGDFEIITYGKVRFPLENEIFVMDFIGMGRPELVSSVIYPWNSQYQSIAVFKNLKLLSNLEDIGTADSFVSRYSSLSADDINNIFYELPPTTNTATINITNNPGSDTCDTSIATDKGYIVKN